MRRVEAACARAGVEVTPPKATPPRTIRRDSESDSESDSEPDDDDRSPPVATAATPSTDIDDISRAGTPQSGPRVPDVVPQPRPRAPPSALLTRAVEAAADAVAAAEAAADASFDDAEERLSPQRDADRPRPIHLGRAVARAASPAPPRPAGLVRARDDALASILGYLDEVEHGSDVAGTAPAGTGARTAASNVPGRHFSVRASVAAVRASYGGPSAKTSTTLEIPSTSASLRASQSESPLRALKRLTLMDASDADAAWEAAGHVGPAAGALATATRGVRGCSRSDGIAQIRLGAS